MLPIETKLILDNYTGKRVYQISLIYCWSSPFRDCSFSYEG